MSTQPRPQNTMVTLKGGSEKLGSCETSHPSNPIPTPRIIVSPFCIFSPPAPVRPRHMPWRQSAGKRPMLAFTPCGLRIAVQVAKLSNLIFSLNSLDITNTLQPLC